MSTYYTQSKWEDRVSQYPNRRRLINNADVGENIYTIERDEGSVYTEGTIWNAKTMMDFDTNIDNAFKSIESKIKMLDNLQVSSGTFTARFYSSHNLNRALNSRNSTYGNNAGYYYCIGKLVFINIQIRGANIIEADDTPNDHWLKLGQLPANIAPMNRRFACEVSELQPHGGNPPQVVKGQMLYGERFISFYVNSGGSAYDLNYLTNQTTDCTVSAVYLRV